MQNFEKLGAFYLGKAYDLEHRSRQDELLLYDSKDLTTHAVCVGMTGSGKTGLCLSLLEEAAIDGVPTIAIDPKGDLGNLLLTFPGLLPDDFRPWLDESAAARAGLTPDQYAAQTATQWRDGLASWGQDPERIAKFRDSVDISIYTPGSDAGLPLTVLRSFAAPAGDIIDDSEALGDRIGSVTSGLLALLGIDADPVQSREYILIANILEAAWRAGRNLDLPTLIGEIQNPPFKQVGVFDVETFFPAKQRVKLSMSLNSLLASPSFSSWLQGEPVDAKSLLYTKQGKPRLSIVSIAHLSESERMFFVTILLNEILTWVRSQPGTSSLRAILYMDEVFGYFPPTANPPSKKPMLTLLKQARAYGLGIVLATQNPVDLDYKGLSNTGTWFLGRLQTERDKARVLEGLEGASAQAGSQFDRAQMEATLAALGSRVFLMNNVHDNEPVVFETRWALSYLRGPLTRQQIKTLMAARKQAAIAEPSDTVSDDTPATPKTAAPVPAKSQLAAKSQRPVLPAKVDEHFVSPTVTIPKEARLVYRPALLGQVKLHFVRATYKADVWTERTLLAALAADNSDAVWDESTAVGEQTLDLVAEPESQAEFSELPVEALNSKSYASWAKQLKDHLYRSQSLTVWKCPQLKMYSQPGEEESDFRIRLTQAAREQRDLKVEKLRKRFASKLATIQSRIQTAEDRVGREKAQANRATVDSAISIGSSILGALFGRKLASRTNISKASTSMKSAGRAVQQRGDVSRAEDKLKSLHEDLQELETKFESEVEDLEDAYQVDSLDLEELSVRPRKSDIQVEPIAMVWTPWLVDAAGIADPAYDA